MVSLSKFGALLSVSHCTRCPETVLQDAGGWLLDLDTVWVAPAPTLGDDKDLGHFFASLQVLLASAVHLSPNSLVLNFEATLCEFVVARVHPAYSCAGAVCYTESLLPEAHLNRTERSRVFPLFVFSVHPRDN